MTMTIELWTTFRKICVAAILLPLLLLISSSKSTLCWGKVPRLTRLRQTSTSCRQQWQMLASTEISASITSANSAPSSIGSAIGDGGKLSPAFTLGQALDKMDDQNLPSNQAIKILHKILEYEEKRSIISKKNWYRLLEGTMIKRRNCENLPLLVINRMIERGIPILPRHLTQILNANANAGLIQQSIHILDRCISSNVELFGHNFAPLLRSAGSKENALEILRRMQFMGIEPNVISYTAAIKSCEITGDWRGALSLFEIMQAHWIAPNERTYNCLLRVVSRQGSSESANSSEGLETSRYAYNILREMEYNGFSPTSECYIDVINACCRSKYWSEIIILSTEMIDKGMSFPQNVLPILESGGKHREIMDIYNKLKATERLKMLNNDNLFAICLRSFCAGEGIDKAFEIAQEVASLGYPGSVGVGATASSVPGSSTLHLPIFQLALQASRYDLIVSFLRHVITMNESHNLYMADEKGIGPVISSLLVSMTCSFSSIYSLDQSMSREQELSGGGSRVENTLLQRQQDYKDIIRNVTSLLQVTLRDEGIVLAVDAYPLAAKMLLDAGDYETYRLLLRHRTKFQDDKVFQRLEEFGLEYLCRPLTNIDELLAMIRVCSDLNTLKGPEAAQIYFLRACDKIINLMPEGGKWALDAVGGASTPRQQQQQQQQQQGVNGGVGGGGDVSQVSDEHSQGKGPHNSKKKEKEDKKLARRKEKEEEKMAKKQAQQKRDKGSKGGSSGGGGLGFGKTKESREKDELLTLLNTKNFLQLFMGGRRILGKDAFPVALYDVALKRAYECKLFEPMLGIYKQACQDEVEDIDDRRDLLVSGLIKVSSSLKECVQILDDIKFRSPKDGEPPNILSPGIIYSEKESDMLWTHFDELVEHILFNKSPEEVKAQAEIRRIKQKNIREKLGCVHDDDDGLPFVPSMTYNSNVVLAAIQDSLTSLSHKHGIKDIGDIIFKYF